MSGLKPDNSSDRSPTRLPLAVDEQFPRHQEGARGGLPLGQEEEATVVHNSQTSSTAALRGEAVRGGVALVQEEATVVHNSQASSMAALRGRGAVALGSSAVVLRGHGTRGGLPLGHEEEATSGIQALPTPDLHSSTGNLRGHGTRGGLALGRGDPTGGIQALPTSHLRSSTAALPAMMPCGSSSSAANKAGGLSSHEIEQVQAIVQNLKTDEPASIRSVCRTALKLHHDNEKRMALAISNHLVNRKCPESTVALNLCAGLHQVAGVEAMQLVRSGHKEAIRAAAFHYTTARNNYEAAARLAPHCIVTAVAHGKVLAASQFFASAQQELDRASSILTDSADDPADHNVGYDIRRRATSDEILHSTSVARIARAHAEAIKETEQFKAMICQTYLPSKCTDLLMQLETGHSTLEEVQAIAQSMAGDFTYCPRAHVLLAHVELLCMEDNEEEIVMGKLREALSRLNRSTGKFRNSLFIAFLRAKMLLMRGDLVDASTEICRALDIRAPSDPKTEDVPVGFVEGDDADGRNSFARSMLEELLMHISTAQKADEEDVEAPPSSSSRSFTKSRTFAKSRHNSAFLYTGHTPAPKKHQDPPLKFTGIELPEKKEPLTFPVHFERGRLVSLWDWSLYRKFCRASSECGEGQMVCHLCCFERGRDIVIRDRDEIAHHHRLHVDPEKKLPECLKCEVDGCDARMRTSMDLHLHRYFVHRLSPGWWRIT